MVHGINSEWETHQSTGQALALGSQALWAAEPGNVRDDIAGEIRRRQQQQQQKKQQKLWQWQPKIK